MFYQSENYFLLNIGQNVNNFFFSSKIKGFYWTDFNTIFKDNYGHINTQNLNLLTLQ